MTEHSRTLDPFLAAYSRPKTLGRFWQKVDRGTDDECWLWTAGVSSTGYGVVGVGVGGKTYTTSAHRVAWVIANQARIPAGREIDHLCSTRLCVNARHLELVTHSTNVRRTGRASDSTATPVRYGNVTVRQRGRSWQAMWVEHLADGSRRQAGRTFPSESLARSWQPDAARIAG